MIDVTALLNATDAVALIGETVRLKRQGAQHYGLCPLHNDKSPTLRVDPKKGLWYCPSCQIGGNAIDWLTKTAGMDFKDAAAELAKRAGIDLAKPQALRIQVPTRPKFPQPNPRPVTPWGGQRLMAGDGRPVYVLNDFPGRRRYLELAERHPGADLIWWPAIHSRAAEMYLEPIALNMVTTEPFGLWEAYRAAALIDAVAGFRLRWRGALRPGVTDALLLEATRIEGWLEFHLSRNDPRPAEEVNRRPAGSLETEATRDVAA